MIGVGVSTWSAVLRGSTSYLAIATSQLGGVTPYHYFDFTENRCIYAGVDVGDVTQATGYSFSRASTGYYQNSDGTLTSFASGAMRRGDRGVLIEGARTNGCLQSNNFASWTKSGSMAVTQNATGPDQTTSAWTITFPAGSDWIWNTASLSANTQYTISVWLSGSGTIGIGIYDSVTGGGNKTLITLTSTLTRYSFTCTTSAASSDFRAMIERVYSGGAATATSVVCFGCQIEPGAFPSSYIPTTTASATRAGDTLLYTAGVSYPATLWAEFERAVDTGGDEGLVQIDDGTNANRAWLKVSNADIPTLDVVAANVGQGTPSGVLPIGTGVVGKFAGRTATNSMQTALNGLLGTADTVADLPATPSTLRVATRVAAANPLFGYVRRLAVFNSSLSDANLQTVTA